MKTAFKTFIFILALTAFSPAAEAYYYDSYNRPSNQGSYYAQYGQGGQYGGDYSNSNGYSQYGNYNQGYGYNQGYNHYNPYQYQYRSYDYRIFSTRARPTYSTAPTYSYVSYYNGGHGYGNYYR